ncbi:Homoserine O-acetyltransferase [Seminavis robusta]|uniref:Homoserine O-acetyltransferase n=1 Tax=Seminavis robusta TaxID=568900 RepID=A0A9N8HTJ0_9STRA|nr:Homoserine O-acetyltransferase [Seminavis robusta]|eukprot:Sro1596_g284810.1 Homoserine O-acetyltransferase (477) ;mRNA; f:16387-17817
MASRLLLSRTPWHGSTKIHAAIRPSASLLFNNASPCSGALGSSLGTDTSMIAANNRCYYSTATKTTSLGVNSTMQSSDWNSLGRKDSSMIAANNRRNLSGMKDEYGEMTSDGDTYVHPTPLTLENGQVLPEAQLRYQTYGELNEARDNVVVICHALTGNASLEAWWGDLLGPGKAFDTDRYLVVCSNILGSCYGSTCPTSINPSTGKPYLQDFPDVSVQDTVRLQLYMLVNALKVQSIKSVIGGSFGGMQAMEFAVQGGSSPSSPIASDCFFAANEKPLVRTVIPIACGAAHTAWQIAISETQRQAIYADPNWESNPLQANGGLSVARQIGMVSYRTAKGYSQKFGRNMQDGQSTAQYGSSAGWKVKSYLEYQGEKFLSRFDPITYVKMTEQMDSHDVARGRGDSLKDVLDHVEIPALVLGIDSDVLYPLQEQQELVDYLPNSELKIVHSDDGHDGFLLEQEQVANHISNFLKQHD